MLAALLSFILLTLTSSGSGSGHHRGRQLHPEHERQFLEALGLSKIPTLSKHPIEIPEVLRFAVPPYDHELSPYV
jgi:hypothetical protein